MTHFVGLNVSVKETSVCVVDELGRRADVYNSCEIRGGTWCLLVDALIRF
jgi:hypothetical protein